MDPRIFNDRTRQYTIFYSLLRRNFQFVRKQTFYITPPRFIVSFLKSQWLVLQGFSGNDYIITIPCFFLFFHRIEWLTKKWDVTSEQFHFFVINFQDSVFAGILVFVKFSSQNSN